MNQAPGLDSGCIASKENECADGISRLSKVSLTSINISMQKFSELALLAIPPKSRANLDGLQRSFE